MDNISHLFSFYIMYSITMVSVCLFFRYEEDTKKWSGMLREMRYAAGSSCVSMRLNVARMPKLWK